MKTDIIQLGNWVFRRRKNPNEGRVYSTKGICPTMTAGMGSGGNRTPFIIIKNGTKI